MYRICYALFHLRVEKLTTLGVWVLKGFSNALDTYQVETFCKNLEVILQCYDQEGWSHPPSRVLEGL